MSQYNRNFLTNVILRIDFADKEISLESILDNAIKDTCKKNFPILDEKDQEINDIRINPADLEKTVVSKRTIKEWHFWGTRKEKHLTINSSGIVIDCKNYRDFETFNREFSEIFAAFTKKFVDVKFSRVGLRYIDQIKPEGKGRKKWYSFWKTYINSKLLSGINFFEKDNNFVRHMSDLHMNYEDYMLHLRYGIYNSDFPAVNKQVNFIIDNDIYTTGKYSAAEVETVIIKFHEKAKEVFENAITNQLRDYMES